MIELIPGIACLPGFDARITDCQHVISGKRDNILHGKIEECDLDDARPLPQLDGGVVGGSTPRAHEPFSLSAQVDQLGRKDIQLIDCDYRLGRGNDQGGR